MKRTRQEIVPAGRKPAGRDAREAPLTVPHGGGDASRDFESAFELLRDDEQARELWHHQRVKAPFPSTS